MDNRIKGEISEEAVNRIAFNTYLKYWCYPNPIDESGTKKEICDLLILFKETVLVLSIKNYSFNGNYKRYFHSTLDKAVSQVQGAERKLFSLSNKVLIKHPENGEIEFDTDKYTNVQRIVVNLNTLPLFYPAGRLTSKKKFVHIFNWDAFLRIVLELDTIPDFIQYLRERERAFQQRDVIIMTGEEDDWDASTNQEFLKYGASLNPTEKTYILLSGNEMDILADYYFNNKKFNKHFYSNEYNGAAFELDGNWKDYLNRKEVQKKKHDDKASYFIDEFVKREVLYRNNTQNIELATELLSFSRFERRIIGKQFFEFVERYKKENGYFVARRYGVINDFVIAFLIHGHTMEDEMVTKSMEIAIEGYAYWENYKTKRIAIIAVSNELKHFKFGYLKDIEPFPREHEERLDHELKLLKWFQNIENIHFSIKEYPE
jgi:hypothetical protein